MMSLINASLLGVYFGGWKGSRTAERWVQVKNINYLVMRTANPHTFWNFWGVTPTNFLFDSL
jgi:DMSO/TMAO reductase YedYZ heme-binding membrane subunit